MNTHAHTRAPAPAASSAGVEIDGDTPTSAIHAGSGLTGLAERARAVRGTLEAGPRREGGFRLRLTIPLVES